MAALAVSSELATMNVCMAIGALLTNILEDKAGMAFVTAYLLVHPAQGVTRLIVIELRIRSNRLPACICVAILTWD